MSFVRCPASSLALFEAGLICCLDFSQPNQEWNASLRLKILNFLGSLCGAFYRKNCGQNPIFVITRRARSCSPFIAANNSSRRNLVNILLYVAEQCKRYFPVHDIPDMLETFLPLLTPDVCSFDSFNMRADWFNGSNSLCWSSPQCWLHFCLHHAHTSICPRFSNYGKPLIRRLWTTDFLNCSESFRKNMSPESLGMQARVGQTGRM